MKRTREQILARLFRIIAKGRAVLVGSAEGRGVPLTSRRAAAEALKASALREEGQQ